MIGALTVDAAGDQQFVFFAGRIFLNIHREVVRGIKPDPAVAGNVLRMRGREWRMGGGGDRAGRPWIGGKPGADLQNLSALINRLTADRGQAIFFFINMSELIFP